MPAPFYAHSTSRTDRSDWQYLAAHLRAVAALARRNAEAAGLADIADAAFAAGLLHDLGKYRVGFQNHICGVLVARDESYHKQAGAAVAWKARNGALAAVIFGHHGGLPDPTKLKDEMFAHVRSPEAEGVWRDALAECPELANLVTASLQGEKLYVDLRTRAIFSCLVDADWTDTAEHERQSQGRPPDPNPPPLEPAARLGRLLAFIETRAAGCDDANVKTCRADVLTACLAAAVRPPDLFSLTVPTGGGKTLAGMAFALKHAAAHNLRRVIYVAPFTSILDQNAAVIRDALGMSRAALDVFEHHSLADPSGDTDTDDKAKAAAVRRAENWSAPVVVTTNVQFFESLFGNKPGRCRKLHNVARSVVILDECQALPPGLVAPTCGMIRQLVNDLGCSVIHCTATQPAFDHEKLADAERLGASEIVPPDAGLFRRLLRARVTWPEPDERLGWPTVAALMLGERAALCVVNTKKAARAVFEELTKVDAAGAYHLSTAMCPRHRRRVLKQVKQRLVAGEPCRLVSTQLIEAGVDVDFPVVLREMAPLESIIQAAGRCNREGRIPNAGGRVRVFRSVDGGIPVGHWYKAARDILESTLADGERPQLDDLAALREYFGRLYHTGALDAKGIASLRQQWAYRQVAETYKLIDDAGEPVIVATWKRFEGYIAKLLAAVRRRSSKANFRRLASFQVNVRLTEVQRSPGLFYRNESEVLIWAGQYDESVGLVHSIIDDALVV